MTDPDIHELRHALDAWAEGRPTPLLRVLGYRPAVLHVPADGLAGFGLDRGAVAGLRRLGRHDDFAVLEVVLRCPPEAEEVRRVAGALYRHNPARRALLVFRGPDPGPVVFASWGLGPGPFRLRRLRIDPARPRRSELDILAGLATRPDLTPSGLALAHARALDREGLTRRFFAEFRRQRAELAVALEGVPTGEESDRLDLALVLLGRVLFLYFLQRKGWLAGDADYLHNLYRDALREGVPFYRQRLKPLFFEALNRPAVRRGARARALGELPYLNGGLFEREPAERRHPRLHVPDEAFETVFRDLLDRYQFTLREDDSADQDVAVDPEMLGKVFEGLMSGETRGSTGAFYTPRVLVDRLVDGALCAHLSHVVGVPAEAIDGLLDDPDVERLDIGLREDLARRVRSVRVLDPAVGTGAFLLSALQRIERLLDALDGPPGDGLARFRRRQEIVRTNLHGVDINPAAVRLCELRLWLALVVDLEVSRIDRVPPLPNLDLKIRQGDTLTDPIDFLTRTGDLEDRHLVARWQRTARRIEARRDRYFTAVGSSKRRAGRALRAAERSLALTFLGELRRQIEARLRDLRAVEEGPDLFGGPAGLSRSQRRALLALERRRREIATVIERIEESDELPFFSFPIHFADPARPDAGFDLVVGNPPWVRTHNWGLPRARLRERFRFLRDSGWRAGSRLGGAGHGFGAQLDLSALFLERGLEVLGPNGALGFLLPAKMVRALYGGPVRLRLLAGTTLLTVEDAALASTRYFEATTYPLALILRPGPPAPDHPVACRLHTPTDRPLDFRLRQNRLPLILRDRRAPWALAPSDVRALLDRMTEAGPPLGSRPAGARPCRGIVTGANSVFVGEASPDGARLDGVVAVRLDGNTARIESERLRPALRGCDLVPWQFTPSRVLVWTHDDAGRPLLELPRHTAAYLEERASRLRARRDLREGDPVWTVFRAKPAKWAARVAWRDIGREPAAAVVPASVPFLGAERPIVSLNTVYQVATSREHEAHLLAAILNSLPGRAFLRAIAERAAGGHFRFLGWTVGLLPFPVEPEPAIAAECERLSHQAHRNGGLSPPDRQKLDRLVGRLYSLEPAELRTLRAFDAALGTLPDRDTAVTRTAAAAR